MAPGSSTRSDPACRRPGSASGCGFTVPNSSGRSAPPPSVSRCRPRSRPGFPTTPLSRPAPALVFPSDPMMAKIAVIRFVLVYSMAAEAIGAACTDITRWLETGDRAHQIAARFPLDELVAAHEAVESGSKIGGVIVDID